MIIEPAKRLGNWILRAANYDFCPNTNWLVYWCKEPIGWVVAAIGFSLLVGLQIGPQGYVLCFAFSALLILGLAWPWLSMKGVACEIVVPEGRVQEGQPLVIRFKVRNYWPLPVFGMMVKGDFLQDVDAGAEPVVFALKRVSAWSETEFQIPLTPRRRGRLPQGDVQVSNAFPFGLKDISKPVSKSASVLVWPACQPLVGFPKTATNRFSLSGAMVDRTGNEGETIGVRGYRNGDQIRSIHWAQSVRTQRLMVRERQSRKASLVTVVMDLTPANHAGEGAHSSYECSIRIAASLCRHLHQSRSPVRLICRGLAEYEGRTVDSRTGIEAIMNLLASLPTLEAARAACLAQSSQVVLVKQLPLSDGRTFFIRTSASDPFASRSYAALQSIEIDLVGFDDKNAIEFPCLNSARTHQRTSDRAVDRAVDHVGGRSEILITAPDLASSQLAAAWSGSFGHEV